MKAGSGLLQLSKSPVPGLAQVAFKLTSCVQAAERAVVLQVDAPDPHPNPDTNPNLPLILILILTLALTRIAIQDDAEMFAVVCQHLEQVLCDLGQALKHHQNRDDILRRIGDILTQASASSPSPLALTLAP